MTFETAVKDCLELAEELKPGLQALSKTDRQYVTCDKPRGLAGSVNLDAALRQALPNEPRWDYVIGLKQKGRSDEAVWLEIHPASSTGEVEVVLKKLAWLKGWCGERAVSLTKLSRRYVWVATGRVAFSPNSPQYKKLTMAGITFSGGRFHLKVG